MAFENPYTQKPIVPPKSITPKNTAFPKKTDPSKNLTPKSSPIFPKEGSFVHRKQADRILRRNLEVRRGLRYDPDLRLGSQKAVDEEITKLEDRLFQKKYEKYGFTPDELKRTIEGAPKEHKLYWEKKHDLAEKAKGGFTVQEIRDIKKKEKELKILKKWAGLDKNTK